MRRILIVVVVLFSPVLCAAAEIDFSLKLDEISLNPLPEPPPPRSDPKTEARLAQWNSPMGRLMHNFNQQQAWIMRGTMPGSERDNGVAVRVKAQNGIPLHLVAATVQGGLDMAHQNLVRFGPREVSDEALEAMSLEEQLTELLSRRLVPR